MAQYFYFDQNGKLFLRAKSPNPELISSGFTEKKMPDDFQFVKTETDTEYEEKNLTEIEESMTYSDKRVVSYPDLGEQLDKLFHDIENGTLDNTGSFFTALKAVKENNPK